jgi:hypothetical protein
MFGIPKEESDPPTATEDRKVAQNANHAAVLGEVSKEEPVPPSATDEAKQSEAAKHEETANKKRARVRAGPKEAPEEQSTSPPGKEARPEEQLVLERSFTTAPFPNPRCDAAEEGGRSKAQEGLREAAAVPQAKRSPNAVAKARAKDQAQAEGGSSGPEQRTLVHAKVEGKADTKAKYAEPKGAKRRKVVAERTANKLSVDEDRYSASAENHDEQKKSTSRSKRRRSHKGPEQKEQTMQSIAFTTTLGKLY